jgi:hypothetical protein
MSLICAGYNLSRHITAHILRAQKSLAENEDTVVNSQCTRMDIENIDPSFLHSAPMPFDVLYCGEIDTSSGRSPPAAY